MMRLMKILVQPVCVEMDGDDAEERVGNVLEVPAKLLDELPAALREQVAELNREAMQNGNRARRRQRARSKTTPKATKGVR